MDLMCALPSLAWTRSRSMGFICSRWKRMAGWVTRRVSLPLATETGSVGALSAAFADRAVALASLYLFASTPIQRVGYNPATKKASARIKLGSGTSLLVGGNENQAEAGIRRRLGHGEWD